MAKFEVSYDVVAVKHSELSEELLDSINSKVPVYVWGPPGVGKSVCAEAVARLYAAKNGKFFVDWNRSPRQLKHALADRKIEVALLAPENPEKAEKEKRKTVSLKDCYIFADSRLSQKDPSDINGLPSMNDKNHVEWFPTLLFSVLSEPEADGMLFFDEIPQAIPSVQNAAYQLIQDRCCGEIAFSPNITVIAAGNRLMDGGNQFQIPPALANRFTHVELLSPTIDDWSVWAIEHGVDSRIVSFLRFKPSDLMDDLTTVRKNKSMAWASPRTWEKASLMIKDIAHNSANVNRVYRKVAMAVGVARAVEFRGFIKSAMTLDIKDILANPKQIEAFDISLRWALISALAEHYRSNKKILDDILNLCRHLSADFAVAMLRMMREYDRTQFTTRIAKCKNVEVALDYLKFFEN